jgi:rhodanese-related sulfurtransferase
MAATMISPAQAHDLLKKEENCALVDVRTYMENQAMNVEGGILAPVQDLDPKVFFEQHPGLKDKKLLLLCKGGTRSKAAGVKFTKAGFENLAVIEGGITAWNEAKLPVKITETKVISIDRQTRIAIGTMVMVFTLLGAFVHPGFLIGAGFMGCGLIFAGVTDTCGLALIIAKMPWNKGPVTCAWKKEA